LARKAKQGKLPKAVILVHLYDQSADIDPILEACNRYGVPLIEDAAEALGATYKGRSPGVFGQAGIFSFDGNKIITTSGGGMLVSDDAGLIAHARKLATQARDAGPHYQHSEIGYNYRLSNILAGVGRGWLRVLGQRVAAKRRILALSMPEGVRRLPAGAGPSHRHRFSGARWARSAVGPRHPLAHGAHGGSRPLRGHPRGHSSGAGAGEHGVPARVEAHTLAAGLYACQARGTVKMRLWYNIRATNSLNCVMTQWECLQESK